MESILRRHRMASYGPVPGFGLVCIMVIYRSAIMLLVLATVIGVVLGGGIGLLMVSALEALR